MNDPHMYGMVRALTNTVRTIVDTFKQFQARLDAVEKLLNEMNRGKDDLDEPES